MTDEHPNITARRKRERLVRLFGERGALRLRQGVMCVADRAEHISKVLNRWLYTTRYGTEWR
jgi:hypothetical protein